MCLLCIEVAKGTMRLREVSNALREFTVSKEHEAELDKVIQSTYSKEELSAEIEAQVSDILKGVP